MHIVTKIIVLDGLTGPGLARYFMEYQKQLQVQLYTNPEELPEDQLKAQIILIGQEFQTEHIRLRCTGQCFFLGAAEGMPRELCLNPYEPGDVILQRIYQQLLKQEIYLPGLGRFGHKKQLVGVFSPHGYDLQTGFSFLYSMIYGETRKVLYLNFQYYDGFFEEAGSDVGELIYTLHQKHLPMAQILNALVSHAGRLDYILPAVNPMDLEELTSADYELLVGKLLEETDYEVIVFNLSNQVTGIEEILQGCRFFYSLQKEGSIYDACQTRFRNYIRQQEYSEAEEKIKVVTLPGTHGEVELKKNWKESLLQGDLGSYVRELISGEELFSCRNM